MNTTAISRRGEAIFEEEVLSKGFYPFCKIPSFSPDPCFVFLQHVGCDYLILNPAASIELKTRSRSYDDFLIETSQNSGPGWLSTAKSGLLVWLWVDSKDIAVIDFQGLKQWWQNQEPNRYKEISAKNHRGQISKSRIIPFDCISGKVPFKRGVLPLERPEDFLLLN